MATLYTQQENNILKTWGLMAVFLAIVVAIGWFFSYYFDNPGILYIAVIFSVLTNIWSYWFSDKVVLAMAGAKPVTREEYFDLYNVVENLSITAGLPMPKLYVINDPVPNAFATGRNKEHAAVAVTSGLLQLLNKTELEGVIAHELSHIGNRDMLLSTVAVILVGFITLLADFFMRMSFWGGGRRNNDREGGNAILMVVGVVFMILSPIIATLMQLAISRRREYLADASGALLTRYPEGLASALEKIGKYSGQMQHANNATAHLYISNPFGPRAMRGISKLFMTHPPIEDRIRILRDMEK